MKIKKLLYLLVISIVAGCILMFVASAATGGDETTFDDTWLNSATYMRFAPHDGLVTANTATLTEKVTVSNGNVALKITPSSSYKGTAPIGIKHTSISGMNFKYSEIKYIRYYYFYEGTYDGYAKLTFPAVDFSVTRERSVYSLDKIRSGGWNYVTFDIEDALKGYAFNDGIIEKINFFPFGDTKVSDLSAGSFYINEMGVYGADNVNIKAAFSSGELVQKYPVSFVSGRPDVTGTSPETILAEVGDTIILPENTFEREGYIFNGWICAVGGQVMQPGDEYTLEERTRVTGWNTAAIDFIADWQIEKAPESTSIFPDVNRVPYGGDFCGGIVDNHKFPRGSVNENAVFDGLKCVEVIPDPDGEYAATKDISLDGWQWQLMPFDLSHYKYLIIPYYIKTENTSFSGYYPYINMLGSATDESRCLTKTLKISDNTALKTNQWACMVFKFDFENNTSYSQYLKEGTQPILNQMHIYPFSSKKVSTLSPDDRLYLADFIFMSEIPENRPVFSKGMISGDGSGTFRPIDVLTKAEAASILAKTCGYTESYKHSESGYTDVKSGDWYLPYISFLEDKAVFIPGTNEKFNPNATCTKDMFLAWIANVKTNSDVRTNTFGNLPANPSSDKGLTRAEAVGLASFMINEVTYTREDAVKYMKGTTVFSDVGDGSWYYPAVSLASVPTVSYSGGGVTKVIDTFIDAPVSEFNFPEEKYEEADEYLEDLESLTLRRIDEIRFSESDYKQKPGGKTIYVSNQFGTGSITSCSEVNPVNISSISEISAFPLNPGDVVLLRRGEVYRGAFDAQPGVTYSAYGDGDKPQIIPSPEDGTGTSKWILDYEDKATGKKIWKYYRDDILTDVGGVNLISDNGTHFVAYKEIPCYLNGTYFQRSSITTEFIYTDELDHNLEFVHFANIDSNGNKVPTNPGETCTGPLYLRCDEGNPGKIYSRIEFNQNKHAIKIKGHGVTIDNLCIKYFGRHGISAGTVHNLTIKNCEIGWGGGSIQHYKDGRVTRFGNGVEIYGALINFVIDNCYVYQIYDAGITHQISSSSPGHYFMEGVYYLNNVLTDSIYNIEYFMSKNTVETGTAPLQERYMKNVYFTNNITRRAGYGWGAQRPDNGPSNVKGWTHHNLCDNQVYENNIFDRCIDLQNNQTDYVIMSGSTYESSTPYMKNNIFVQTPGRILMYYGKTTVRCALDSEETLNRIGGVGNKLYFSRDDTADYQYMVWWKD